jgi:hypothetical protein
MDSSPKVSSMVLAVFRWKIVQPVVAPLSEPKRAIYVLRVFPLSLLAMFSSADGAMISERTVNLMNGL